eukprot:1741885-Rhodomonas_salina.1
MVTALEIASAQQREEGGGIKRGESSNFPQVKQYKCNRGICKHSMICTRNPTKVGNKCSNLAVGHSRNPNSFKAMQAQPTLGKLVLCYFISLPGFESCDGSMLTRCIRAVED